MLPEVLVTYELTAFGKVLRGSPIPVAACWDVGRGALCRARGTSISDVAIARELAYGMCPPGVPPGPVAFVIRAILDAASGVEAKKVLDELGFARVDLDPLVFGSGGTISQIGADGDVTTAPAGDAGLGGQRPVDDQGVSTVPAVETMGMLTGDSDQTGEADTQEEQAEEGAAAQSENEPERNGEFDPDEEAGYESRRGGDDSGGSSSGGAGGTGSKDRSGTRSSGKRTRSPRPQAKQGRFVTYVVPAGASYDGFGRSDGENAAVELAGVDAAVEYENRHFRYPNVMPPGHPGYDIESCDGSARSSATSRSRRHPRTGARLAWASRRRSTKALKYREDYWLYVVERACYPDQTLYRIQDPASKVTHYFYDGGWRGVSETGV